jgi:hypothetical protein
MNVIFWLGDFSKKQPKFKGPTLDVTKKSNSSASLPTLKKEEEEVDSDSDDSETKKQRKIEHKRTQSENVYRKSVGSTSGLSNNKRSSRILVEEETSSEDDQEFITKNKKGNSRPIY